MTGECTKWNLTVMADMQTQQECRQSSHPKSESQVCGQFRSAGWQIVAALCFAPKLTPLQPIHRRQQKYLVDAGGFGEIDGLPAINKGSEGEVHVLNCGSALPATNSDNGLAAPDSSCSIEVEEAPSGKLDVLFTFAVEVQ